MARFRLIRRLLRRFSQVDNWHRLLLAEAMLSLLAARLAVIFISFPRLAARFGTLVPSSDPRTLHAAIAATPHQIWMAKEISWAITRAARYTPFHALCLPQAIAAHAMLKRRGVGTVMRFGAAIGQEQELDAHAWLHAAGVEVTGYPVAERITEIACFV